MLVEDLSKVDNIEKLFTKCIKKYTFFVPMSVRKMSFPTLLILSSLLFKILTRDNLFSKTFILSLGITAISTTCLHILIVQNYQTICMTHLQVTDELTVLDIQHFSFGFDRMHAAAPEISLVLHDFYVLLYTAGIHTSGFGHVVFPHKILHFLQHVCVTARWKALKQRCR